MITKLKKLYASIQNEGTLNLKKDFEDCAKSGI